MGSVLCTTAWTAHVVQLPINRPLALLVVAFGHTKFNYEPTMTTSMLTDSSATWRLSFAELSTPPGAPQLDNAGKRVSVHIRIIWVYVGTTWAAMVRRNLSQICGAILVPTFLRSSCSRRTRYGNSETRYVRGTEASRNTSLESLGIMPARYASDEPASTASYGSSLDASSVLPAP